MVKTYCTDYSFNLMNVSSAGHHILYLHMTSFLSRREKEQTNRGIFTKENTPWMKESSARFKVLNMIHSSSNGKCWSFLEIAVPGQGWLVILHEQCCLTLPCYEACSSCPELWHYLVWKELWALWCCSDQWPLWKFKRFPCWGSLQSPAGVQWLSTSLCFVLF